MRAVDLLVNSDERVRAKCVELGSIAIFSMSLIGTLFGLIHGMKSKALWGYL